MIKQPVTKIIFCDVDGVFTNIRTGWYNFDIYSINFILYCAKHWNAKIVISSSTRFKYDRIVWNKIFNGMLHIHYTTPATKLSGTRGHDIQRWLDEHPTIEDYLIIDDSNDMLTNQFPHFIQTDLCNGLTYESMVKISNYLGLDERELPCNDMYGKLYIHKFMFHYGRKNLHEVVNQRRIK